MRYWERNIGDIAAATRGMNFREIGIYDVMLDAYYLDERPLPLEIAEVCKLIGAERAADKATVEQHLRRFFAASPHGWVHERCEAAIQEMRSTSSVRSTAARRRWELERQGKLLADNETPDANALHVQSRSDANAMLPIPHTPLPQDAVLHTSTASKSGGAKKPRPRPKKPVDGEHVAKGTPVWNAYSAAYEIRYGTAPVRNAKSNAIMAKLVDRIGEQEAPHVAAHFVRASRGLYVSSKHAPDLLLRDCEGLRTEWATGRSVTDTQARQADRTATTGATFGALKKGERNGTDN